MKFENRVPVCQRLRGHRDSVVNDYAGTYRDFVLYSGEKKQADFFAINKAQKDDLREIWEVCIRQIWQRTGF